MSHLLPVFPLFLFRLLLIFPPILFVLRPSSDNSSTSSSSLFTRDESAFANALPISMLNSMAKFYPLNSLLNGRERGITERNILAERLETDNIDNKKEDEILERKTPEEPSSNFGRLKLCPPGGRSFFEAFELACPMKKRRRKRHTMFGFGRAPTMTFGRGTTMVKYANVEESVEKSAREEGTVPQRRDMYRPANITELMHICCIRGCEFSDLLPHCGPFSIW